MGLSICHSIISKHNGSIKVNSVRGKGTTFDIYLPASLQKLPEEKQESQNAVNEPLKANVLVMDDEELIRQMAKEMLSKMGHKSLMAEGGSQAVELYKQSKNSASPVDVVIMDLTIPGGMGGKAAVKKLLDFDPEAKVIVSSGYSNDPVMADFFQYGFHAAIVKPFKFQQLYDVIAEVLQVTETSLTEIQRDARFGKKA